MADRRKSALRIYEYVSEDGITFWSFTKLPHSPAPSSRLTLQDLRGSHFRMHLAAIRRLAQEWEEEEQG